MGLVCLRIRVPYALGGEAGEANHAGALHFLNLRRGYVVQDNGISVCEPASSHC